MKKLLLILLPILLAGCNEKLSDEDIIRQNVEQAVMSMYSTDFIQTIDLSGFAIVNLPFEDIKKTDSYTYCLNNLTTAKRLLEECERRDCDSLEDYQNNVKFCEDILNEIEGKYTPENYTIIHEYNILVNNKVTEYIKIKYYINENYEIFSSDIILAEER